MKLFDINMNSKYGDGYLSLAEQDYQKINNYQLVDNKICYQFNHLDGLVFHTDNEYPNLQKALGKSDIFRTLSFMPLFSSKLANLLTSVDDFTFFNVKIKSADQINEQYRLPRINKFIPCIDDEQSQITGNPFFDKIVIKKNTIPKGIFAFINQENQVLYTEEFIKLIYNHHIDIDFYELDYEYV